MSAKSVLGRGVGALLPEDLTGSGEEKFFQFGLYMTVSANTKEELTNLCQKVESMLGGMLMGPAGFFEMSEGVIRALRHVHMAPDDAAFYGVKAGDAMKLQLGGPCGITLDRLLVRVDKSFKLEVHIDTD